MTNMLIKFSVVQVVISIAFILMLIESRCTVSEVVLYLVVVLGSLFVFIVFLKRYRLQVKD